MSAVALARPGHLTGGSAEALKWIALVLMTGDHIDAALFGRDFGLLSEFGRLVMPIFACVLAFNLARPHVDPFAVYRRTVMRCLVVGALAYPFHVQALGQGWYVLNILFSFAAAAWCMYLWETRGRAAMLLVPLVILVSGSFTEFGPAGQLMAFAWWLCWRPATACNHVPLPVAGSLLACSYAVLCMVNGNAWALLSLPVIALVVMYGRFDLPRFRWAFYGYYPVHLAVLAVLSGYVLPAIRQFAENLP